MITREEIIAKARECGFEDVGFTSAEPFTEHGERLGAMEEEYAWATGPGGGLKDAIYPEKLLPDAESIIVLVDVYLRESFPPSMERHFGRCYLDDDRVTRDGRALRIKEFRAFLREKGINSKLGNFLPHRVAAVRAGLGTLGKNCLFYSRGAARGSSWVHPIPVVVDHFFEADVPSQGMGCPEWCRNACVAACPTGALKGRGIIDPRRCISWLTYCGEEITPMEFREPMGLYVYGCDRCQNVCPRNSPWLGEELPVNERVLAKADNFDLVKLLHMKEEYFLAKVWPHMFYMGADHLWKWKMNVARVMGNMGEERFLPELRRAFHENEDSRVQGMIAWSVGQIGGVEARKILEEFLDMIPEEDEAVAEEIGHALGTLSFL